MPLIYLGLWINFSSVNLSKNNQNQLVRTIGFPPLLLKKEIDLTQYDCMLIKFEKVSYSSKNWIIATPFLGTEKIKDQYTALYLKYNRKYDFDLLIKSSKPEIIEFVKIELLEYNLPIFEGALKKGQELKL